jgi:hypothetical protein
MADTQQKYLYIMKKLYAINDNLSINDKFKVFNNFVDDIHCFSIEQQILFMRNLLSTLNAGDYIDPSLDYLNNISLNEEQSSQELLYQLYDIKNDILKTRINTQQDLIDKTYKLFSIQIKINEIKNLQKNYVAVIKEQENDYHKSELIDKRNQERQELNEQLKLLIKSNPVIIPELTKEEKRMLQMKRFLNTEELCILEKQLLKINVAKDIEQGKICYNLDKEYVDYLEEQDLFFQVNIPDVKYKIGVSLQDTIDNNSFDKDLEIVDVFIYIGNGKKPIKYPLNKEDSYMILSKLE